MECLSVAKLTNQLQNISLVEYSKAVKKINKLTRTIYITVEKSPEHNVEKNKSHRN